MAAGSSDWVVYPQNGCYPADEATFLHNIISTIANDLQGQSHLPLAAWLAERHAQIERGELTYTAHQLDFLGCDRLEGKARTARENRAATD